MFTGLIEGVGIVERIAESPAGVEVVIRSSIGPLEDGESIAVNGACLTVRGSSGAQFSVAAVSTTLERTCIGRWGVGQRVNLERALRMGDRLGGHIVQGHVDCVGQVLEVALRGTAQTVQIEVDGSVHSLLVPLGSVAVDGVSLTVNALPVSGVVEVSLVEYTLRHTTLASLQSGDAVHIEADAIGKYVKHLLAPYVSSPEASGPQG